MANKTLVVLDSPPIEVTSNMKKASGPLRLIWKTGRGGNDMAPMGLLIASCSLVGYLYCCYISGSTYQNIDTESQMGFLLMLLGMAP